MACFACKGRVITFDRSKNSKERRKGRFTLCSLGGKIFPIWIVANLIRRPKVPNVILGYDLSCSLWEGLWEASGTLVPFIFIE